MPGKNPRLNPLESRRQMLLAESELNRMCLRQEWHLLAAQARAAGGQVKTLGSIAAAATSLAMGLAALRRKKTAAPAEKFSWWPKLLQGVKLAGSLWSEFRPPRQK